MRISFVGMSNIGKSFWAKRMAAEGGCEAIECDALIEKKLSAELGRGGFHGIDGLARWMGFPAEAAYESNSARYLECEQTVMRETLDRLQADSKTSFVIDTTGSVIYMGADILNRLRTLTRVLYFEASPAQSDVLLKNYLTHPKPVIWGDAYATLPGEAPQETLTRCFPELVRRRAERYKEIAHKVIPFDGKNQDSAIRALIEQQAALS